MGQEGLADIAPLVKRLAAFCQGHEDGDGGVAAARMLAHVRASWPEVPPREISHDDDPEGDLSVLALRVVRDVGDAAERLLGNEGEEALGWARANLVIDLERYLEVVGGRQGDAR